MALQIGRLPTVPEYYQEYINKSVNLIDEPKQCCPFHKENTPSFSYMREKGVWSCFGACHCVGADVIEMHRRHFKLNTREEAELSLRKICRCTKKSSAKLEQQRIVIDEEKVEYNQARSIAHLMANTVERYLELDYLESKYPNETWEFENLVAKWKAGK